MGMRSWPDSVPWPWVQRELEYHLLLARDLMLIPPNDYKKLQQQTTELKRMLTAFIQKLER